MHIITFLVHVLNQIDPHGSVVEQLEERILMSLVQAWMRIVSYSKSIRYLEGTTVERNTYQKNLGRYNRKGIKLKKQMM